MCPSPEIVWLPLSCFIMPSQHCRCGEVKLVEVPVSREGLGSMSMIQCQNEQCMESSSQSLSFPCSLKGRFYDVNRRSALAMRRIGRGYSALQKFSGIMNLPPPLNEQKFQRHQHALSQAACDSGSNAIHAYCCEGAEAGAG